MSEPQIELLLRQIEVQFAEYETAAAEALAFMADWRSRTDPAAKRVQRFREAAAKRESAA